MSISIKEIRESGLLELYVLGDLNQEETRIVDGYLSEFPELLKDLDEINSGIELYDNIYAETPPSGIIDSILSSSPPSKSTSVFKNKIPPFIYGLLGLLTALLIAGIIYHLNEIKEKNKLIVECERLKSESEISNNLYASIMDGDNKMVVGQSTDKFSSAETVLILNDQEQRAYINARSLPSIATNQQFQLWSLRDGQDPRPLDVFDSEDATFLEFEFIADTDAYALTIEPRGGSTSPNLDDLITVATL